MTVESIIVCKNCGTKYIVYQDELGEGRVVRCSYCDQVWYQRSGNKEGSSLVVEQKSSPNSSEMKSRSKISGFIWVILVLLCVLGVSICSADVRDFIRYSLFRVSDVHALALEDISFVKNSLYNDSDSAVGVSVADYRLNMKIVNLSDQIQKLPGMCYIICYNRMGNILYKHAIPIQNKGSFLPYDQYGVEYQFNGISGDIDTIGVRILNFLETIFV
ncbi:MAG: MJ0042 family finger-like domain protein [Candidatus Xenolissoclinum pacificiensis L6]|uniref:MJ0042 family finger-like domain protein n=1 Tax=Candidatus Xenolissoclinum pacificiensis L6 TaxID=1401685 RepID=W2V1B8_9RICK|nr:MAG: MJ0042 family finger-like domain protein [Candidatus Xenolissoclinum pacificiensis L6]